MRRGEIRWYTFARPDKRRPVLLLTRDVVIESLNEIIVVPATSAQRPRPHAQARACSPLATRRR